MGTIPLHTVLGIAIAKIIPNPWISLPLSFLSHTIIDLYPEWYDKKNKYDPREMFLASIESVLILFIMIVIIQENNWVLLLGAISANLIDLWDGINELLKKKPFWFCHGGEWPMKVDSWQGTGMRPIQTAFSDSIFVVIILLLITQF